MMSDETISWLQAIEATLSPWFPLAALVFRAQMDLFIWSQVNVDSAKPVHSLFREILSAALTFLLFHYAGEWIDGRLGRRRGKYAAFFGMVVDALCWELFFSMVIGRLLPRAIFYVDSLSPLFLEGRDFLNYFLVGH